MAFELKNLRIFAFRIEDALERANTKRKFSLAHLQSTN